MWHVLHAAPNGETQVCKYLGLHGIEAYAPQFPPPPQTRPGSVRDRKHRWVFPGYVFFQIEAGFSRWDLIRWAPGVRRTLDQDGGPASLADEVIDRIRRRLTDRQLRPVGAHLTRGQRVVIESGPLRMVDAIFEKNLDSTQRVEVLVQLLGRSVAVELDSAAIRRTG